MSNSWAANFATQCCSHASSFGLVRMWASGQLSVQAMKTCLFSQWMNFLHAVHFRARNTKRWAGYLLWALFNDLLVIAIGRVHSSPGAIWDSTAPEPSDDASVERMKALQKSGWASTTSSSRASFRFCRAWSRVRDMSTHSWTEHLSIALPWKTGVLHHLEPCWAVQGLL